jgi:hypothetical protein
MHARFGAGLFLLAVLVAGLPSAHGAEDRPSSAAHLET